MSGLCTKEKIGRGRVQTIFLQVVIYSSVIGKIENCHSACVTDPRVRFLYTTSKIILAIGEEQCTHLVSSGFQL